MPPLVVTNIGELADFFEPRSGGRRRPPTRKRPTASDEDWRDPSELLMPLNDLVADQHEGAPEAVSVAVLHLKKMKEAVLKEIARNAKLGRADRELTIWLQVLIRAISQLAKAEQELREARIQAVTRHDGVRP